MHDETRGACDWQRILQPERMTARNTIITALGLLVLIAVPVRGQSTWCLAPGDSSAGQLATIADIITASDSAAVNLRDSLGLSGLDTTDIQLVMEDSICVRVDSAVMRSMSPQVLYPAVVYRLGPDRFASFMPGYSLWAVFFIDDHYDVMTIIL